MEAFDVGAAILSVSAPGTTFLTGAGRRRVARS